MYYDLTLYLNPEETPGVVERAETTSPSQGTLASLWEAST